MQCVSFSVTVRKEFIGYVSEGHVQSYPLRVLSSRHCAWEHRFVIESHLRRSRFQDLASLLFNRANYDLSELTVQL